METLDLTNYEFRTLTIYRISEEICHTEANLFRDPQNIQNLLKIYGAWYDKDWMREKFKSVQNLIKFTNEHDIPELLRPNGIVLKNGDFVGTRLPLIPGHNAKFILNAKYVPIKTKIAILKQIGSIIKKVHLADKTAAFADVHADNFIISNINFSDYNDVKDLKTTGIDTDSMKIYDSPGISNFYLCDNQNLANIDKYEQRNNGNTQPCYNTDLFCFMMMVLELISNDEHIVTIPIDEYNEYLDYLAKLGFDNNLLSSLHSVYDKRIDNIEPFDYLDSLEAITPNSSIRSFKGEKKWK